MNIKKGDVFVKGGERLEVIKIAGNIVILSPMDEVNGVGVLRFLTEGQLKEFGYQRDGGEDENLKNKTGVLMLCPRMKEFGECGIVGCGMYHKCACGLEWGHSGKHGGGRATCEHGTYLAYFCEGCDGAKITKSLDEEADRKAGHTTEEGAKIGCPFCVYITKLLEDHKRQVESKLV